MKLKCHYVEKPWGRTDLPPVFSEADGRKIGEVWFDAEAGPLPILIKWLFTSENLSIQVHPNDAQAQARGGSSGKEECWIVTSAEPDARLGIGTLRSLDAQELRQASLSGEIEHLMDWKPVQAGDYFYIPAGTVHAIGGGVTLVEVQQNADITYRLYDYGRPRELHLDDGIAVSRAAAYDDPRSGRVGPYDTRQIVYGPHFDLWHAAGNAIAELASFDRPHWLIPIRGQVHCGATTAEVGECLYGEKGRDVSVSDDAVALVAATCRA